MPEQHVEINPPQGRMPTFDARPQGSGSFPVVILYTDAPAIREEPYDVARRIADHGYYLLLPDLFYRFGTLRFPIRNDRTRKIWHAAMADLRRR